MASSTEQPKKNGRGKDKNGRKMHPNSLKNLRTHPWKPGQSGNPEGSSITFRQKMMMLETCPFDGQDRTWLEALAEGGMRQALTTPVALSNLQDRHEGKVTIPIGGEDGGAIKVDIDAKGKLLGLFNRLAARAGETEGSREPESTGS